MAKQAPNCPLCGSYVADALLHAGWHESLGHLGNFTRLGLYGAILDAGDAGDYPTAKLPPITETVRRRPPVPGTPRVTELSGAELVEALMAELERERDGGDEL